MNTLMNTVDETIRLNPADKIQLEGMRAVFDAKAKELLSKGDEDGHRSFSSLAHHVDRAITVLQTNGLFDPLPWTTEIQAAALAHRTADHLRRTREMSQIGDMIDSMSPELARRVLRVFVYNQR